MPWISIKNPSQKLLDETLKKVQKDSKRPCPDCGVKVGTKHSRSCDVARCLKCGGQKLSCTCRSGGYGDIWDGLWPGTMECYKKGYLATLKGCGKFDTKVPTFDFNRLAEDRLKKGK